MAKRKQGPGVHAHGCTSCRDRYEDACDQANQNALCLNCRVGRSVRSVLLILTRMPHTCCFQSCELASKKDLERQRLSNACQWFICSTETCRRTFPYLDPSSTPVDERFPACCLYAIRSVDDIIRHRLNLAPDVCWVCVLCGKPAEEACV